MSSELKKPQRIALFGNFGINNLGNECTLQAVIYNIQLRLPSASMFIVCADPIDAAERHQVPAVPIGAAHLGEQALHGPIARGLRFLFLRIPVEICDCFRVWKQLKGVDILLMAGTGMIADHGLSPFGFLFEIFKWSAIARIRGTKVRFAAVGVGPLRTRIGRWFVRRSLSRADYRSYRDQASQDRLIAVGFDASCDRLVPDLAFSLPEVLLPATPSSAKPTIGVGVIDFFEPTTSDTDEVKVFENYLKKTADFVDGLIDRGFSVRLLYGDSVADHRVGQDLATRLKQRSPVYGSATLDVGRIDTVEELLTALAETDLVVSGRFHNLLLGLLLRKPIIAIAYDAKNDALAEMFGFGPSCQPICTFDPSKLITDCLELMGESRERDDRIDRLARRFRKIWESEYRAVLDLESTSVPSSGSSHSETSQSSVV